MNPLFRQFLKTYAARAKHQFTRRTQAIAQTQEQFLLTLLRRHEKTVFGQQWQWANIRTVDEFRDRLPVCRYDTYEPYVKRIIAGEPYVLNPHPVVYLSLTSGTTGSSKWVPVTQQYRASLQRPEAAALGFTFEQLAQRQQTLNQQLMTNGATLQGITESGIEYGPVTVGRIRQGKRLMEQLFAVPYDALQIADTLARHYVCLLFAMRSPRICGVTGNFPTLLLQTCRYLEEYGEALIEDVQKGTIAPWLSLEPALRQRLEQRWSAAPERAAQLRGVYQSDRRLTPRQVWPDLKFLITARGGTSDFYFSRFPQYFGEIPVFGGVYGTAEGTFGVCPEFNLDGYILAIESGFYEFVSPDQWEAEHPKTLLPQELTVGQCYRIIVTSYSGFYRYDIGDVVEVVGFYHQTPMILFRHRRGGLLSSTTEKTTEFHVMQVMQQLQREFDLKLEDFCVTLSDQEFPARYLVNIELVSGQSLSDPQRFLHRFEELMCATNNPYGTVRQGPVPPPHLQILANGSFASIRQRLVKRGSYDATIKIPHISEDRQFLSQQKVEQVVQL